MRIGYWAEASITPETFVFGTPSNHVPLIEALQARGHTVELIHVPWKQDGEYVMEPEKYRDLRTPSGLVAALNRRKSMENLVRDHSGLDATARTFAAAERACMEEPTELPYDAVYMKLPPPGFLRTKLEVVYNLWRFMRAGVPVFVFDGELMWDVAVPWVIGSDRHSNPHYLHLRLPYFPKHAAPNYQFWPFFYDPAGEIPLDYNKKRFDLVYVGNDWKQENSPRAAGLGKYYATGRNAVYGRWTDANRRLSGVPAETFYDPIPSSLVRTAYSEGIASVVIAMNGYYKHGLVTQRYREIIQGGALCLVDSSYSKECTDHYVDAMYRVNNAAEARDFIAHARSNPWSWEKAVYYQRDRVKSNPALRLDRWVEELERLGRSR